METKEAPETMSCLQNFVPPSQKSDTIGTENSAAFTKACKETNGGRQSICRVKEGTAIALVCKADCQKNGGTVRRNAIITCNVHDEMADDRAFKEMWPDGRVLLRPIST